MSESAASLDRGAGSTRPRRTGAADERVYRELFDAIIDHRVPPGTPLPEDTLAGAFGVSRTVVRKAPPRLGHEKLAELRPNRGAVVARPTVEEARAVFEARRVVAAAVGAAAVGRGWSGRGTRTSRRCGRASRRSGRPSARATVVPACACRATSTATSRPRRATRFWPSSWAS